MTTRTKPYRLFEADTNAIIQLAAARAYGGAELVHQALQEYVVNHRDEFVAAFSAAQEALGAGDLARLGEIAASAREAEIDAIMADHELEGLIDFGSTSLYPDELGFCAFTSSE